MVSMIKKFKINSKCELDSSTWIYYIKYKKVHMFHWQFLHIYIFSVCGSVGWFQSKECYFIFVYTCWHFFLFSIKKFMFLSFSLFFWWSIKFPQQNINQWETGIGDKKLLVELYLNYSTRPVILYGNHFFDFPIKSCNLSYVVSPNRETHLEKIFKIFSKFTWSEFFLLEEIFLFVNSISEINIDSIWRNVTSITVTYVMMFPNIQIPSRSIRISNVLFDSNVIDLLFMIKRQNEACLLETWRYYRWKSNA